MPKKTNRPRRRLAAPIGGIFIILALIGAVTVIISSIRMTTGILDNDRAKKEFEDIIRPVAMFDPIPFENPSTDLDMANLLRYSIWATLMSDKRSSYQYDEYSDLVVPATDLDVAAAKLFGPELQLVHRSVSDYEVNYYYDEQKEVYYVPVSARLDVYTPKVYDIMKEGEYLKLYVGYIPPSALTVDSGGVGSSSVPDKYMVYLMKKVGDSYQIAKVQDPPPELQAQNNNMYEDMQ